MPKSCACNLPARAPRQQMKFPCAIILTTTISIWRETASVRRALGISAASDLINQGGGTAARALINNFHLRINPDYLEKEHYLHNDVGMSHRFYTLRAAVRIICCSIKTPLDPTQRCAAAGEKNAYIHINVYPPECDDVRQPRKMRYNDISMPLALDGSITIFYFRAGIFCVSVPRPYIPF
jgi:hypothetical protein